MHLRDLLQKFTLLKYEVAVATANILKRALTKVTPYIDFSETCSYENYSNIDFLKYEVKVASPKNDSFEVGT